MKHLMTALLAGTVLAGSIGYANAVTYIRGNDADPETLDQHKTSTVDEANILRDLYEGLVIYDAKAQGHSRRGRRLDDLRRRPGLHLQTARRCQMVERRPGRRPSDFVYLVAAHHGSGDRRQICQHPLSDQKRREDQQGRDASPTSSASRRSTTHAGNHAGEPDAVFPRTADAPDRPAGASRRRREISAPTSCKPDNMVTNGAYKLVAVHAQRQDRGGEEPAIPRCRQRQDRQGRVSTRSRIAPPPAPLPGRRGAFLLRRADRADQVHRRASSAISSASRLISALTITP